MISMVVCGFADPEWQWKESSRSPLSFALTSCNTERTSPRVEADAESMPTRGVKMGSRKLRRKFVPPWTVTWLMVMGRRS